MEFVPLGINNEGLGKIKFTISIHNKDAKERVVQIRDGVNLIFEERITDPALLTQGDHVWYWDGFDTNGILDTKKLTDAKGLNLLTKVWYNGDSEFDTVKFKMEYQKADWVDLKIDKNSKRIDVTLRINLKEGKIDKEVNKSFSELVQLAKDGLKRYWGRNNNHIYGQNVDIYGQKYLVYVNAINTTENSMPKLKIYAFKNEDGRSRNWWLSRKLFYNEDFTYDMYQLLAKQYPMEKIIPISKAEGAKYDEMDYKHTAAHEIGHEILKTFGGAINFSYTHKGTSTLFTQETKPSSTLPPEINTEIDLMKYYDDDQYINRFGFKTATGFTSISNNFYERNIASEKDVLGLLWCSMLKIKG